MSLIYNVCYALICNFCAKPQQVLQVIVENRIKNKIKRELSW